MPAMCRFCFRRQAAAPDLASISNLSKHPLVCKGLKVPRKFATLLKKVANPKGVTNRYALAAAPGRRWSAGAAPHAVPAGALDTIAATNFVGTKALERRPPTAPAGRPKAGHRRRRRSSEFWNAGSALGNLGAAICNPITDTPPTSEVHPDLDASAILSRAASIRSRLAASCDWSQDRPRAQPVFPQVGRYAEI